MRRCSISWPAAGSERPQTTRGQEGGSWAWAGVYFILCLSLFNCLELFWWARSRTAVAMADTVYCPSCFFCINADEAVCYNNTVLANSVQVERKLQWLSWSLTHARTRKHPFPACLLTFSLHFLKANTTQSLFVPVTVTHCRPVHSSGHWLQHYVSILPPTWRVLSLWSHM